MRSVKYLVAAGAASLLSSVAFAADMPSIMPPPPQYYAPPPAQDFGGWYLRGDIGMTNHQRQRCYSQSYDRFVDLSLPATGSRASAAARPTDSASATSSTTGSAPTSPANTARKVNFNGTDFTNAIPIGGDPLVRRLQRRLLELGRPGQRLCRSRHLVVPDAVRRRRRRRARNIMTSGFQDSATVPRRRRRCSSLRISPTAPSKPNFAWALHAGVAYKVTNNFTVELGLPLSRHGQRRSPGTGSFVRRHQRRAVDLPVQRHLTSQDVKIGVRWTCCDARRPPPPLVRKG